jgi:hypothetical protein
MARPALIAALIATFGLAASSPAYAAHKDETATSGQVTATFSYDYKRTRYGPSNFSNLHLTIDRAGQRLADIPFPEACDGCAAWPAGGARTNSITVRDIDGDGEPEVLLDLYSGGAHCCWYTNSFRFDEGLNRYVEKVLRPGGSFPYTLRDINKDGVPEFRTVDYRFSYKYGSYVDTPPPIRIFDWDRGLVDVTIQYPKIAAREAAFYYKAYLSLRRKKDLNLRGVLAAYLADSYNAHNGRAAWGRVVAAYRRGELNRKIAGDVGPFGKAYLTSLRRFLKKTGYLRRP